MLISVIIPTRNRFDYIKLMLADLQQQELAVDFEVIVVDQSDDPKPLEHCTHIITDTKGPCVSRNIGVKHSKGEILLFLDDDARIGSDFIKEMTAPIVEGRYPVVAGAICDPEGHYLQKKENYLTRNDSNFLKILTSNPNHEESRITLAVPGCCMAMQRHCFDAVGGFEESFDPTGAGEDREMAVKCYKHGFAIWYNAKAKLLHAVNAQGGSRDVGSRSLMLDVHSYRICRKHFSNELAEELKETILRTYRKGFYKALRSGKLIGYKYKLLQTVKQLLNE
jgi:GT2 family glycosyltransferase